MACRRSAVRSRLAPPRRPMSLGLSTRYRPSVNRARSCGRKCALRRGCAQAVQHMASTALRGCLDRRGLAPGLVRTADWPQSPVRLSRGRQRGRRLRQQVRRSSIPRGVTRVLDRNPGRLFGPLPPDRRAATERRRFNQVEGRSKRGCSVTASRGHFMAGPPTPGCSRLQVRTQCRAARCRERAPRRERATRRRRQGRG